MEQQKIQMFLMSNQKNFEASQLPFITDRLAELDDDKLILISSANYKDPTTMLVVSLFLGGLGIDRFMIRDTGLGVLKLLTGGCFGVLTIIDWFIITKKTRQYNFNVFMNSLNTQNVLDTTVNQNKPVKVTEKIRKYKEMLDNGIITQDEFDEKKKELLSGGNKS